MPLWAKFNMVLRANTRPATLTYIEVLITRGDAGGIFVIRDWL